MINIPKDSFVYGGRIIAIENSKCEPVPIDAECDKTLTGKTNTGRMVVFQLANSAKERSIFYIEDTGISHATRIKGRERVSTGHFHMSGDDGLIITHLTVNNGEFTVMFQHRFPQ